MGRKNGLKIILFFVLLLSLTICFFGCKKGDDEEKKGITVIEDNTPVAEEVIFTVSFDSMGGSSVNSVTAKVNNKIAKPSDPVKTGFLFDGWYLSENFLIRWDFNADIVTENTTLYAKWNLIDDLFIDDPKFSVTADKECLYSVNASSESVDFSNAIILKNVNYRYAFFKDQACSEQASLPDTALLPLEYGDNIFYVRITNSNGDLITTVKFTVKRNRIFTVRYFGQDGAFLDSVELEEGSTVSAPTEHAIIGHDTQWKTADGAAWNFGSGGTVVSSDVDLYAYATTKTFSVKLNVNGGLESYGTFSVLYGETFSLPVPTKEGSGFMGWYTEDGEQITGSNGVSVGVWSIRTDVTLVAKWQGNSLLVIHGIKVNNMLTEESSVRLFYGNVYTASASSDFEGVKKTGNEYTLNVFGGWYNGMGDLLSRERSYSIERLESNTSVYEYWYTLVIKPFPLEVDQIITFESDRFEEYGNVTLGDKVVITADCDCQEHTFTGWDTVTTPSYSFATDVNYTDEGYTLNTHWAKMSVSAEIFCDDELVTQDANSALYASLSSAINGLGNYRKQKEVELSVQSLKDYTFAGWYEEETQKSDRFDYSFVMNESVVLKAKWFTTTELFHILSLEEQKGTVTVESYEDNNIVGGNVTLKVNGQAGYILEGLIKDEEMEIVMDGFLQRILPSSPVTYTAKFIKNTISVKSNLYNAGKISYRINQKNKKIGTTYGSDFEFDGMLNGDTLTLYAESYDGYVWLGWYKDDQFVTNEYSYSIPGIVAGDDEFVFEVEACWKPVAYSVNVKSAVYSQVNSIGSTITKEGLYYTYNWRECTFEPAPVGSTQPNVNYYVYSANTYTGGTQSITANTDRNVSGEIINLKATVANGYRFEGWYNENKERITVNREYSFNVKDLRMEYIAIYSLLPGNYYISVDIFEGTEDDPEPKAKTIGSTKLYAYYEEYLEQGEIKLSEKCSIDVMTYKNSIDVSTAVPTNRGYNFLGLYEVGKQIDWSSFQEEMESPDGFNFMANIFGYRYTYDITSCRENNEKPKSFMAAWRHGSTGQSTGYYSDNISVYSDNKDAGSIFYLVYNNSTLVLMATPLDTHEFIGWYTRDDEGNDTFYNSDLIISISNNAFKSRIYVAKWKEINTTSNTRNRTVISVDNESVGEAGEYDVVATRMKIDSNESDFLQITAKTNTGYIFLGWYLNDILLQSENDLYIMRMYEKDDENNAIEKVVLTDENGTPYMLISQSNPVFQPRWKKSDAQVVVDSVGDVEIIGFYAADGTLWYRLKTSSVLEFNDNNNAWHKGYYFLGWYDSDNNLIESDYELYVQAGRLLPYYKAAWTDVKVYISINPEEEEIINPYYETVGGKATYGFNIRSDKNAYLTLYAVPEDKHLFMGWVQNGHSDPESYKLTYDILLGSASSLNISTLEKEAIYIVVFTSISENLYPTARVASTNSEMSETRWPTIIGYRDESNKKYYIATAKDIEGYIFVGWRVGVSNEIISYDKVLEYEENQYAGNPIALYREISDYYSSFRVKTETKYSSYVTYYGYLEYDEQEDSTQRVIAIAATVPTGYTMRVRNAEGDICPTDFRASYENEELNISKSANVVKVFLRDENLMNGLVYVDFILITDSSPLRSFIQLQEQINNVLISDNGHYEIEEFVTIDESLKYAASQFSADLKVNEKGQYVYSVEAEALVGGKISLSFHLEESIDNAASNDDVIVRSDKQYTGFMYDMANRLISELNAILSNSENYKSILTNGVVITLYPERIYYAEKWTVQGAFDDLKKENDIEKKQYAFLGWYDEGEMLLSIEERYTIDALRTDAFFSTKFGIYRVELNNTNTTAGHTEIVGYDVSVFFKTNGANTTIAEELSRIDIPMQTINVGETLQYPKQIWNISTDKYLFAGWYLNPEGEGNPFDFEMSIKSDLTLYGKWIDITEFGGTKDEISLTDGTQYDTISSYTGKKVYFTAATYDLYTLFFSNLYASQITYIDVEKISLTEEPELCCSFMLLNNTEAERQISVVPGGIYRITLTTAEGTPEETVSYKIKANSPVAHTTRDTVVPFKGSFAVRATVNDFDATVMNAYKFLGWYAENGMEEPVLVSAKWDWVTGDDKRYSVYGYDFGLSQEDYARYADDDGVIYLEARWETYHLEIIQSDANGGYYNVVFANRTPPNDVLNWISPTNEEEGRDYAYMWELQVLAYENYRFGGWYKYDTETNAFANDPIKENFDKEQDQMVYLLEEKDRNLILKCQWDTRQTNNKRTISYVLGSVNVINSMYNPTEFVVGESLQKIPLFDPIRFYKEDEVIKGYYVFEGWYEDENYTRRVTEIDPSVPPTSYIVTFYAKWGRPVKDISFKTDEDGVRYFFLGSCPQSLIDPLLLNNSNMEYIDGLYYLNGQEQAYYRVDKEDGGKDYYAIEPIRWDIINMTDGILAVTHKVLFVTQYNSTSNKTNTYSSNDWENSGLRYYLNHAGFTDYLESVELNLLLVSQEYYGAISNKPDQGNPAYSGFSWSSQNDTEDAIYAMSYKELTSHANGFKDNASAQDNKRIAEYTDYALYLSGGENIGYWTRTAGNSDSTVYYVTKDGALENRTVTLYSGVRATIKMIDFGSEDEE